MTYLLIGKKKERLKLILTLLEKYFSEDINIDEIHYLLELIINDTIFDENNLFDKNCINICELFREKYIDYYNDLPAEKIDVDPLNYVLKKEFNLGLKKLYNDLLEINK